MFIKLGSVVYLCLAFEITVAHGAYLESSLDDPAGAILAQAEVPEAYTPELVAEIDSPEFTTSKVMQQARAFTANGDYGSAERVLKEALLGDLDNLYYANRLAMVYLAQKKYEQAVPLFRKSLSVDTAQTLMQLVTIASNIDDPKLCESLIPALMRVREEDSNAIAALFGLGLKLGIEKAERQGQAL